MNTPATSAYAFFIGWFVIIGLFYGSLALEGTRTLTYYVLWLNIILLLVTHSTQFAALLEGAVPPPVQSDTSTQQERTPQTQFAAL